MARASELARHLHLRRKDRQEHLFWTHFSEALKDKELEPQEFSIRALFESFVPDGRELVDSWNPRHGGGGTMLYEAGDAVKTSDFSNITGQIVYTTVLDAFNDPAFVWPMLADNTQTSFDGEKIPGIGRIGDEAATIGEADPFPYAGVSEEFVETPSTTKRGFIVPVTKEAVFFDRTNVLLQRANEVSYWLGLNKEKRVIAMATGATTNLYKRNGTLETDIYADNSGTHNFDNLQASNSLQNFTDIEVAERLLIAMTDPNTGEPISVIPNTIMVPPALRYTARNILASTNVMQGPVTSSNDTVVVQNNFSNPISGYTIVSSQLLKTSGANDDTTWFLGDPKRAFTYMMNWDITSVQAPTGSHEEFQRDIIQQFKVSERGTVAVLEPRRMVKCTA